MKYYACAEIAVTNPDWIAEYVAHVTPLVEAHGGRYLARTSRVELIEGERQPESMLLIEFDSREAVDAFYTSVEYAPHLKARKEGSVGRFLLVTGKDDFRAARIAS